MDIIYRKTRRRTPPPWPPSGLVPLARPGEGISLSLCLHSSTQQHTPSGLSISEAAGAIGRESLDCQPSERQHMSEWGSCKLHQEAAPAPDPTIVPVPALTCTSTNLGNLSIKGPNSKQTDSNKAAGWRCNNNNSGWCNLPDSPKNRWWRGQLSRAINQHTLDSREQTDSNRA